MAIHAYNENYVDNARTTLATMLDYAVNYMHRDIDTFFIEFITSGIASRFGTGDPLYITGKSGVDLYHDTVSAIGSPAQPVEYIAIERSAEYWLGSYLAYAEWYLNIPFRDIFAILPLSVMVGWYDTAHEADVARYTDDVYHTMLHNNNSLKEMRELTHLSQTDLANMSGVPLRSIQMYEQCNNDIAKAQYSAVANLARCLSCNTQDIVSPMSFRRSLMKSYSTIIEQKLGNLLEYNAGNADDASVERLFHDMYTMTNFIYTISYDNIAQHNGKYYASKTFVNQLIRLFLSNINIHLPSDFITDNVSVVELVPDDFVTKMYNLIIINN